MKFFKNIVWVLLLGASFVAQAMYSNASSSGASSSGRSAEGGAASSSEPSSSSASSGSGELTREENDFLLHYDGGDIPADKQKFVDNLIGKIPAINQWRRNRAPVAQHIAHTAKFAFSPDGTKLAYSSDEQIVVLNVADWTKYATGKASGRYYPTKLVFAPDGVALAVDTDINDWHIYHIDKGEIVPGASKSWQLIEKDFRIYFENIETKAIAPLTSPVMIEVFEEYDYLSVQVKDGETYREFLKFKTGYCPYEKRIGRRTRFTFNNSGSFFAVSYARPCDEHFSNCKVFQQILLCDIQHANFKEIAHDEDYLPFFNLIFSPDGKMLIALKFSDLVVFSYLPATQLVLEAKAIKNPAVENTNQRKKLQELAYNLPAEQQKVILDCMPLLKKEFDDTEFAHYFPTKPITLRTCDGIGVEFTPGDLQHLRSSFLAEYAKLVSEGKEVEKLEFDIPEECCADSSVLKTLQNLCRDNDPRSMSKFLYMLDHEQQYGILRICDFLLGFGCFNERAIDSCAAQFIENHALANFGLPLGLPDISRVRYCCRQFNDDRSAEDCDRADSLKPSFCHFLLSFSSSGRYLMGVCKDGLTMRNTMSLHKDGLQSCHLSWPDFVFNASTIVAWGSADEKDFAVCTDSQCKIVTSAGNIDVKFPQPITNLAFLNNTTLGAFSKVAQQVYQYDLESRAITQSIPIEGGPASIMALSPNKTVLAVGMERGVINLVNPMTLEPIIRADGTAMPELMGDSAPINALVFSPDGRLLASYANDGTIRIRETATGSLIKTFEAKHNLPLPLLTFYADGNWLLLSDAQKMNSTIVFNIATGWSKNNQCTKSAIFDPTGVWYAYCSESTTWLTFGFPHQLPAEQYLLLEKAWAKPELFSEYLTPEERAEIDSEQIKRLEGQQKDYLATLYRQLPGNLQRFVRARMPWIGE